MGRGTFILPLQQQALFALRGQFNPFPPQIAEPADKELYKSYLGTPIFDNLVLLPKDTGFVSGVTDPTTGLDRSALVLNDILLTVTQAKVIIKTPINGRDGTVKEYIALDDFRIDVQGFIITKNPDEFPQEQMELFQLYADLKQQLSISSSFLDIFRIRSLVIETYRVAQEAGFRNRVPFTMSCISDEDIELQLSEDVNSTE